MASVMNNTATQAEMVEWVERADAKVCLGSNLTSAIYRCGFGQIIYSANIKRF